MLEQVQQWPPADCFPPGDLRILVRASHVIAESDALRDAIQLLLCRHILSGAIRPLVMTLFQLVDGQVQQAHPKVFSKA